MTAEEGSIFVVGGVVVVVERPRVLTAELEPKGPPTILGWRIDWVGVAR